MSQNQWSTRSNSQTSTSSLRRPPAPGEGSDEIPLSDADARRGSPDSFDFVLDSAKAAEQSACDVSRAEAPETKQPPAAKVAVSMRSAGDQIGEVSWTNESFRRAKAPTMRDVEVIELSNLPSFTRPSRRDGDLTTVPSAYLPKRGRA